VYKSTSINNLGEKETQYMAENIGKMAISIGVYVDVDEPEKVFINPTEICIHSKMEVNEPNKTACFVSLEQAYAEEGYQAVLIDTGEAKIDVKASA